MIPPQLNRAGTRRRLLQLMAAAPLLAPAGASAFAQDFAVPSRLPDPMSWAPRELATLISDPAEAL